MTPELTRSPFALCLCRSPGGRPWRREPEPSAPPCRSLALRPLPEESLSSAPGSAPFQHPSRLSAQTPDSLLHPRSPPAATLRARSFTSPRRPRHRLPSKFRAETPRRGQPVSRPAPSGAEDRKRLLTELWHTLRSFAGMAEDLAEEWWFEMRVSGCASQTWSLQERGRL